MKRPARLMAMAALAACGASSAVGCHGGMAATSSSHGGAAGTGAAGPGGGTTGAGASGSGGGAPDGGSTGGTGTGQNLANPAPLDLSLFSQTVYVDQTIGQSPCSTYDASSRACTGGTSTAYPTLAQASAAVQPGTLVYVRAGMFDESLVIATSGTASAPIAFKAYAGETATLSGADLSPAIDISNVSYVIVDGLQILNVARFVLAYATSHSTIQNATFKTNMDQSAGGKAGLFFQGGDYNQVLNNWIEGVTADSTSFIDSSHNLLISNTYKDAGHVLFTIKCSSYNVVRSNYFYNSEQKIGETYDCDDVVGDGPAPLYVYNATTHNLVEDNDFAYTPSSAVLTPSTPAPFDGIQEAGQSGIIRKNRFYDMLGPGIDLTNYAGEAQYVTGNRVYHNVFYATGYAGVSLSMAEGAVDMTAPSVVMGAPGSTFYFSDNVMKNNALAMSQVSPTYGPILWTPCYMQLSMMPVQIVAWGDAGFSFQGNDIFGGPGQSKSDYLVTYIPGGAPDANSCVQSMLLVPWVAGSVTLVDGTNFIADPAFVDAAGLDFHPTATSPLVDAGVFLTQTAGAGSGTSLPVEDASYFFDGFGIPGQVGDVIQLAGQTTTARVTAVDFGSNTLTVDQPLSWQASQGVSLAYAGKAPDVGVYEYGL